MEKNKLSVGDLRAQKRKPHAVFIGVLFGLVWLKNRGRFLVHLVVQASTRAIYFFKKDTYDCVCSPRVGELLTFYHVSILLNWGTQFGDSPFLGTQTQVLPIDARVYVDSPSGMELQSFLWKTTVLCKGPVHFHVCWWGQPRFRFGEEQGHAPGRKGRLIWTFAHMKSRQGVI